MNWRSERVREPISSKPRNVHAPRRASHNTSAAVAVHHAGRAADAPRLEDRAGREGGGGMAARPGRGRAAEREKAAPKEGGEC